MSILQTCNDMPEPVRNRPDVAWHEYRKHVFMVRQVPWHAVGGLRMRTLPRRRCLSLTPHQKSAACCSRCLPGADAVPPSAGQPWLTPARSACSPSHSLQAPCKKRLLRADRPRLSYTEMDGITWQRWPRLKEVRTDDHGMVASWSIDWLERASELRRI